MDMILTPPFPSFTIVDPHYAWILYVQICLCAKMYL